MKVIKSILLILALGFIIDSYAAMNVKWQSQRVKAQYRSNKKIVLNLENGKQISFPKGTSFNLVEVTPLNMIKVQLLKYKIDNCPSLESETDLELVKVKQTDSTTKSVGVNLTKGCTVEVYVEAQDFNSNSFLQ